MDFTTITGIITYILFEQASELASGEVPLFTGPRIATYDGSKFTPEEQQAIDLLSKNAEQSLVDVSLREKELTPALPPE